MQNDFIQNQLIASIQELKQNGVSSLYISDVVWQSLLSEKPTQPIAPQAHRTQQEANFALKTEPIAEPVGFAATPPAIELPHGDKATQMEALKKQLLACPIAQSQLKPGKKLVFGTGLLDADIFFCGEAPGADEEIQGEPFVGPAGQLLTRMIHAMGLKREQVYISNILKWRPPMPTAVGNRPPTLQEMSFCLPYLKAQFQIIQPKLIVALGATAVNGLLGIDPKRKMSQARGQWYAFEHFPVMVTYHPSYLLRHASQKTKREVWEDMLKVMERLSFPISEKQRGFFQTTDASPS